MTLISSKIICLQSILRINCKALLRFPVATVKRNSPWCVSQPSLFHKHESTNTYVQQNALFTTDFKKTKKKNKDDDRNFTLTLKPSLEKTSRHYTEEQDKIILARVKEMGYDNPETWKSLAKDFNIKQPYGIKKRYDLLIRRGSGKRQRQCFTKEEDALILERVEEMGRDNIETWKTLAHDLDRNPTPSYLNVIKRRYDLIINRDTAETKRFTKKDDNLIKSYVEKNGESKTTWQELSIKLGTDDPKTIELHYHNMFENFVKGRYTKEEDQIILNDVKIHGNNIQTFKTICAKLNRLAYTNIMKRFDILQNKPAKKPGRWEIDEDQLLMEHIFQVRNKSKMCPM